MFSSELVSALENSPAGAMWWNNQGSLLHANAAGLRLLEAKSIAELQARTIYSLADAHHGAALRQLVAEIFQGQSGVLDFHLTGLKGHNRALRICASPMRGSNGTIIALLGLFQDPPRRGTNRPDITLISSALEHVREAAFLIGQDARFLFANKEACRSLRYAPADLLELSVLDIDPDLTIERWHSHWREIQAQHSARLEGRHRASDGGTFPVEVKVNYFEYRGCGYYLALVRNLSDRQQMEQALAVREHEYRTLLENIPSQIVRYNTQLHRIYVNPAWEKASGVPASDVLNRPATNISKTANPAVDEYLQRLQEVLQTGKPQSMAFSWVNARNETLFLDYVIVPEYDRHGKIISALAVGHDLTQRKRAERDLLMLGQALNKAAEAVFLINEDLRFTYVNDAACSSLGYSRQELLGKTPMDINPDVTRESVMEMTQQLFANDYRGSFESRHRTRDGRIFPVEITASLFEYDGQKFNLAIVNNITERKRVEKLLQESEERLRLTLETAQIGIWDWDLEHDTWYASPVYYTALGYEPREGPANRHEWLERVHPNDQPMVIQKIQAVRTRNFSEYTYEARLRHADGTYRWQQVRGFAIQRDSSGKVTRLLGVRMDIHNRKQAEQRLELLELALDQVTEAAFLTDKQGCFRYVNAGACRALKFTREELLGLSVPDIDPNLPPEKWEKHWSDLQTVRSITLETHHRTRDGRVFPVEVNANFFEHDGQALNLALVRDISDRKRMEESLAAREREFRTLVENTPDAIVRYDLEGRRIYFNPAFERAAEMSGRTPAELLGRTSAEISVGSAETGRKNLAAVLEVIRAGAPLEFEIVAPDAMGRNYHCHCQFVPEFDHRGKVVSVLNIVRDITERKRAEAQRLAHLRFLECMDRINLSLQGTHSLDHLMPDTLDVVLSIFNCDRAYLMYPCDPDAPNWSVPMERTKPEYPGANKRGLVVPMDAEVAQTLRILLASDGPVKFGPGQPHALPADTFERFGFRSFMAMAVYPKIGKPWQFGLHQCSFARDWTPEEERLFQEIGRRLADGLSSLLTLRDLRENQSKLAEAERVAHVGYWERDFDGERVSISAEARSIMGIPAGEVITDLAKWHERWLGLIHADDREHAGKALASALQAEVPYDVEYRVVRADGTKRIVRSHGETTRDESGRPRRIFGILQDVTERRQLEEQLRQSQKLEAIGQLAGGVAHDFNNILTSMIMQVDLGLEDISASSGVADCLRQIRSDADRAANLTRQLLLFSRRQIMQPRNLDLNDAVTNLTKMLQRIIGEDVRLQLLLHPSPLITHVDAGMLDQVLMNLAVNARDAMPEGGNLILETSEKVVDEVITETDPEAKPGLYACLSVSDTGSGIPPEVLPHIFEPFFTTKVAGKGTGLGLATVFGIVKQHRGWLKVYSEPGNGTTFHVFLPKSRSLVPAAAAPGPGSKPPGGAETILFAEDESSVRLATHVILSRSGYNVLTASTGAEALELWQQHGQSISLLLTDLVMPGNMTGLQVARRLHADNAKLKVLFTSGHSAEIAGRQIELRPGDNFLQKPYSMDQLLKIVRTSLDA